ncbi:PAS domain-containing hybrid sensor histidine kinase/response regulator [Stenotrophomonas koreensis]
MSSWILLLVSLAYAALLFGVAWLGDRHPMYPNRPWLRPVIYSLALAVYCSSWTFYGAVGTAVRDGLGYLPIYLGPVLLMLLGWRVLERLVHVARRQNMVSIADFIASRYGHSRRLGALVALIALIGVIPYLALQYKAVAMSLQVLSPGLVADPGFWQDPALYVALMMAVFAILFGARRVDATERHHGMMLAIALESVVKLVAIGAVGVFAWRLLGSSGSAPLAAVSQLFTPSTMPGGFIAQTVLSFLAMLCLPRQFHVAVVECGDVADVRRARWLFSAYLLVISLAVLPIATAGVRLLGADGSTADSLVLALPLANGHQVLALVSYIGGFSAATGMVVVSSIALATMISNDLIMPLLLRRDGDAHEAAIRAARVLWIRRLAILGLGLAAYSYYRISRNDASLASYGLMAFVAVAQFAPALIAGLYWRGTSRRGAELGVLAGFLVWGYTLLLPTMADSAGLRPAWILDGPAGMLWLQPQALLGIQGLDPLTHATLWSLLLNSVVLIGVSWRWPPGMAERLRAAPFLEPASQPPAAAAGGWSGHVQVMDLLALAGRVLGDSHARGAFDEQAQRLQLPGGLAGQADRGWVQFTERLLAASIGATSARLLLTSLLRGSGMRVDEVMAVLDEAGQELRFNREILHTTLENISAGVSVVDAQMRLIAWNGQYQAMFGYPDGMLYVGRPVADLIRYNAKRGEVGGSGDVEEQIARRISHMRAGTPHVFERVRSDGRVFEMRGQALQGGGYVTSYNDITEFKRVERALLETNETLEQRVAERTQAAEQAQASRTRFLAAISHDVLQPLNAARLFASALREHPANNPEQRHLVERIDASLRGAEELLDGLLDVSRLDGGGLQPKYSVFDARVLVDELASQYAPVAAGRGLKVHVHGRSAWVHTDRRLLRRVLQNFLANALRYTRSGRIVLAVRQHQGMIWLQVWDTGPGIPQAHMQQIFNEFHRYQQSFDWGEQGLGLGLSICQRIARLLDHRLAARSQVGHGSMFAIGLSPVAAPEARRMPPPVPNGLPAGESLAGLRVLCVDNDHEILDGMRALLARWQVTVIAANTVDQAVDCLAQNPDVMLVDYHLHDRLDGLQTLDLLRQRSPRPLPGALLTADGRDELKKSARDQGWRMLTKPVKPASLRAFLSAQVAARRGG